MKNPEHINLILEWFKKEGDDFIVGEEVIPRFPAKEAHKILGITDPRDHFVCNGYRINKELAETFQQYVEHRIDLDKYEYFISGVD